MGCCQHVTNARSLARRYKNYVMAAAMVQQLQLLQHESAQRFGATVSVLFMGDFNCKPSEPSVQMMLHQKVQYRAALLQQ